MPDAEWQQYSGTLFLKRNSRKFGNEKKIEQKKVHYLGNSVLYIKHFDGRTLDMEQNTNKAKWRMKADNFCDSLWAPSQEKPNKDFYQLMSLQVFNINRQPQVDSS